MKKLLVTVGWLFISVPALIVCMIVWGVANFIGQEIETPFGVQPECGPPMAPVSQKSISWRSGTLSSVRSIG
jgi:hypothetical protein